MGQLVKATRWIRDTFELGSRPSPDKVREWVESELVPGRVIGDIVYIDAEAFSLDLPLVTGDKISSGIQLLH